MLLSIDKMILLSVLFIKHGFPASVIPDEHENSFLSLNLGEKTSPRQQRPKQHSAIQSLSSCWYELVSMGITVA